MSVLITTRVDDLPGKAAEAGIIPAPDALGSGRVATGVRPEHYPAIGAVALDGVAAIAGPTWILGYERAWSAAFEIVVGSMPPDAVEGKRRPSLESGRREGERR
jgi:hypothetical protein